MSNLVNTIAICLAQEVQTLDDASMKSKVYTKRGDTGETSLFDGHRTSKNDTRLHAYGTIDELNSCLGLLHARLVNRAKSKSNATKHVLMDIEEIQNELFIIGSHLATTDEGVRKKLRALSVKSAKKLEQRIDQMTEELPVLKNFILPGQDELSATAHICRTVCRRAERWAVALGEVNSISKNWFQTISEKTKSRSQTSKNRFADESLAVAVVYLNRLSDYLFVLSRYLQVKVNRGRERLWK